MNEKTDAKVTPEWRLYKLGGGPLLIFLAVMFANTFGPIAVLIGVVGLVMFANGAAEAVRDIVKRKKSAN